MCVFWGVEDFLHGVPRDCHRHANNTVPIQVALFQSEAMHMPISLGQPVSRLQRLDLIIQFHPIVLILCFTHLPASPEEALDQELPYVQKELLGPDGPSAPDKMKQV